MELPGFSARRATLEDLPALQALWQQAGLPWDQLDKFVSEFQVAADESGSLLAAIGLLVEGDNALLHTEAISPAATLKADELRSALWRRVQIVARNQGVVRVWTQEDGEFWHAGVFQPADQAQVKAAGASFLSDISAAWFVCELIDPAKAKQIVNEQFAIWEASRTQEREDFRRKTRLLMAVAVALATVVIGVCLWLVFRVITAQPDILKRIFGGG